VKIIKPQEGAQTEFLRCNADICIYGGSAGGGKSYALLLEPLRYVSNPKYNAVIFRKNSNQITSAGGLWDTSQEIYSGFDGAEPRLSPNYRWIFPSGATVNFNHLESERDLSKWQGSQICYIGFDELTHFSERSFFYMLSRNRSTCGVKPCVRATCNPDSDSWVAKFISWWIDEETGYPIQERSGKKRWMIRVGEKISWFDDFQSAYEEALECGVSEEEARVLPKSVTFIRATVDDNKILMEVNPQYKANLMALAEIDKERLLYGNWKIKPQAGLFFKRTQVDLLEELPPCVKYCRAWDIASTTDEENGDADYTASCLMARKEDGGYVVIDVTNKRIGAGEVERYVYQTSLMDRQKYGYLYSVHIPQDPASAGKILAQHFISLLAGWDVRIDPVSGSKETRAMPLSAQWQNGKVDVLLGDWNEEYFNQMESFPESKHDDMVDATSDAFNELAMDNFNLENLI